jgi:hypothetical protein
MAFPLTAAEVDAVARKAEKPFDYYLSSAFWRESRSEGLVPEKSEGYRLIGIVLGLPFQPHDFVHPFRKLWSMSRPTACNVTPLPCR